MPFMLLLFGGFGYTLTGSTSIMKGRRSTNKSIQHIFQKDPHEIHYLRGFDLLG